MEQPKLTKAQAALLRAMQAGDTVVSHLDGKLFESRDGTVTKAVQSLIKKGLAIHLRYLRHVIPTQAGREWSDADQSG